MYDVISADCHLETRPVLWTERLPKELRESGPRIVDLPDGGQGWVIGDGEPAPLGLNTTGGQKYSEFKHRGRRYDENLAGTGDPAQRIAEQDRDGTDAEVLFSTVVANMLPRMADPVLKRESVKAYNEWLSEYCSFDERRLFGIALVPPSGIDDAVAEVGRVAGRPGIRGVHLLKFPTEPEYLTKADDRFWQAVTEVGMPVVCHHNFGGGEIRRGSRIGLQTVKALDVEGDANLAAFISALGAALPIPTLPIFTILQLMTSGVLDRYPTLRFHFAETGIGWLPYWLEQMEDLYDRHRFWSKISLARRPTEYIRDHFTFSFQEDHVGVALRNEIGINNICWASDFPHSVGDWPWSRETRARLFNGLPSADVRRIQALNIAFQLGVISAEEREKFAQEPLTEEKVEIVPERGARRIA